jgi:hypothetical protein
VLAAALSGDFDFADQGEQNGCMTTDNCIPFAGGLVVAAIIMAVIVPLGFRLARLGRGYPVTGFLLPIATEQFSDVNLVGTVHPLPRTGPTT